MSRQTRGDFKLHKPADWSPTQSCPSVRTSSVCTGGHNLTSHRYLNTGLSTCRPPAWYRLQIPPLHGVHHSTVLYVPYRLLFCWSALYVTPTSCPSCERDPSSVVPPQVSYSFSLLKGIFWEFFLIWIEPLRTEDRGTEDRGTEGIV